MPAYPRAVTQLREPRTLCELTLPGSRARRAHPRRRACRTRTAGLSGGCARITSPARATPIPTSPARDWGDNAERFLLSAGSWPSSAAGCRRWAGARMCCTATTGRPGWPRPCCTACRTRPATVFTIHNLAYQGLFDRATFDRLGLPPVLWSLAGLEFHQRMSFIKGGIVFSDRVNTVSPTYARGGAHAGARLRAGRAAAPDRARFSGHPQRHRLPRAGTRPPTP